jgi:hypothetical protein
LRRLAVISGPAVLLDPPHHPEYNELLCPTQQGWRGSRRVLGSANTLDEPRTI